MPAISLPPTPYDATAERPAWSSLPDELRSAIAERLGSPVVEAVSGRGGFTRGFAAVLRTAAGHRAFVKAARHGDQAPLCDWYAREAAIAAVLPASVPAPRPRWTLNAAGHFVVCLDAVDGHIPALPWDPAELNAALDAWARAAEALRDPPAALLAVGMPRLVDLLRADLSCWQAVATGREPLRPAAAPAAGHLPELAALEAALPGYAEGTAVIHCDLRLDNVLIDRSGAAWLVDWNWPCLGAQWFDTATLLVTAYASGLDADALFAAHPTARDAPPDALDATLATLAGFWLSHGDESHGDAASPIRGHQRWSGEQALSWLASRRNW